MKFQVNRDVFSDAVSFAVRLLPQRTTLPILSGVLLHAEDGAVTLSSFDYEVSAQTRITADVETLRLHYALTVREWLRRFTAARVSMIFSTTSSSPIPWVLAWSAICFSTSGVRT